MAAVVKKFMSLTASSDSLLVQLINNEASSFHLPSAFCADNRPDLFEPHATISNG